jgi:hypothetical protein
MSQCHREWVYQTHNADLARLMLAANADPTVSRGRVTGSATSSYTTYTDALHFGPRVSPHCGRDSTTNFILVNSG